MVRHNVIIWKRKKCHWRRTCWLKIDRNLINNVTFVPFKNLMNFQSSLSHSKLFFFFWFGITQYNLKLKIKCHFYLFRYYFSAQKASNDKYHMDLTQFKHSNKWSYVMLFCIETTKLMIWKKKKTKNYF